MFNYFLNYKNCEAEDLEYISLYLATVKSKNDGVVFEDISQKFYDKHIGYYNDKRADDYMRMIYNDWENTAVSTDSDLVGASVYDNCSNLTCLPVFQIMVLLLQLSRRAVHEEKHS